MTKYESSCEHDRFQVPQDADAVVVVVVVVVVAAAVVVVVVPFRSLFTCWLNNVVANYRESESNSVSIAITARGKNLIHQSSE